MMRWIARMVGDGLRSTSTHRHPSAIALAFAFGLSIGLIPKDNLFVLALTGVMCFLRMNYLLATSLIVLVSIAAPWTDGMTNPVGRWMLERPSLQMLWNELASWPIVPWFRWNNSVVMGGFLFGMASFAPVYIVSAWMIHRVARASNQRRVDAIVSEVSQYQVQVEADQRKRETRATKEPTEDRQRSINKRGSRRHRIDKTSELEVAKPNVVESRPEPAMAMMTQESPLQVSTAVLRETVIEIVRYRPKGPTSPSKKSDSHLEDSQSKAPESAKVLLPVKSNPMDDAVPENLPSKLDSSTLDPIVLRQVTPARVDEITELRSNLMPIAQEVATEKPREEALRYLLWHLSGVHRQQRQPEQVS